MAGFLIFMPATAPRSQITPGIPEIPDSKVATLSVSFIIYSFSRQKFPRLCTFPINTRCRISGNTSPRDSRLSPRFPRIPDSKAATLSQISLIIYSLSRQKSPACAHSPINTRCRISGNTFPRFPIIPEIPDNSRFKGYLSPLDASLCKRDNPPLCPPLLLPRGPLPPPSPPPPPPNTKKEALQMKSFFFYFL